MQPSVVFLDVDGVIVHRGTATKVVEGTDLVAANTQVFQGHRFFAPPDRACLQRVNRIVQAVDAEVVLSSTWKKGRPLEVTSAYFRSFGAEFDLSSATPVLDDYPGHEIAAWREQRGDARPFVILDDSAMAEPFESRLVHVRNGFNEGGLKDEHVDKALQLFGVLP